MLNYFYLQLQPGVLAIPTGGVKKYSMRSMYEALNKQAPPIGFDVFKRRIAEDATTQPVPPAAVVTGSTGDAVTSLPAAFAHRC
jgi:hypothetical protein